MLQAYRHHAASREEGCSATPCAGREGFFTSTFFSQLCRRRG